MNPQEQNDTKPEVQSSLGGKKDNHTTILRILLIIVVAVLAFAGFMYKTNEINELKAKITQTISIDEKNDGAVGRDESDELVFQDAILKNKRILMMYSDMDGVSGKQLYYVIDCNKEYEKCLEIASDADMSVISDKVANQVDGETLFHLFYRCDKDTCSWFGNKESGVWIVINEGVAEIIDFQNGKLNIKGGFELDADMGDVVKAEITDDGVKVQYTDGEIIYFNNEIYNITN